MPHAAIWLIDEKDDSRLFLKKHDENLNTTETYLKKEYELFSKEVSVSWDLLKFTKERLEVNEPSQIEPKENKTCHQKNHNFITLTFWIRIKSNLFYVHRYFMKNPFLVLFLFLVKEVENSIRLKKI